MEIAINVVMTMIVLVVNVVSLVLVAEEPLVPNGVLIVSIVQGEVPARTSVQVQILPAAAPPVLIVMTKILLVLIPVARMTILKKALGRIITV